ncbi:MAG: tetratricopeptide repeat protein [Verrucomicrobia bacterium]|nr:tetratricopeptide repeat protein [Verrucomicrobiota bacterium]
MAELTLPETLQLAVQHHQAGRLPEAEALYRQILALDPSCIDALHLLGVIALQVGQNVVAVELIGRAAAVATDNPTILANLGEAYRRLHRLDDAIASFRRALDLQPDLPKALSNLGNALATQDRLDEAITCFRRALELEPDFANSHNNLGISLVHRGQLDEALACFQRALALKPDFAEAHNNLGCLFKERGQLDEALEQFRLAVTSNPDYPAANANFLFTLPFHPDYDAHSIFIAHRNWSTRQVDPIAQTRLAHPNDRSPDRRLRIGYVSPDFRDHVVGRNLLPLFRNHLRSEFEIFCYTDLQAPDHISTQFRACADTWRNISGVSDPQVADLIDQDQIDILVDLALHMAGSRLLVFARKPAPVQVTFAGYPGTTGVTAIDYRLTDPYLDPPGLFDSSYAETSFCLADSFWCYAPLGDEPAVRPLPAEANGFITFGNLNSFCKINTPVLRLWAHVLHAVARSRILLMADDREQRQRVLDTLVREGISPDRVEFSTRRPRLRYLDLYHEIDLGLDTFPYNGHTTSLDSYFMGVPVVSLVGATVVGRAGLSQLSNLGLTELAAHTDGEFVRIVSTLAHDMPRLAALRASLRERMQRSPLMDAPRFARAVETAYRTMWRRWCGPSGSAAVPTP